MRPLAIIAEGRAFPADNVMMKQAEGGLSPHMCRHLLCREPSGVYAADEATHPVELPDD